MTELNKLSNVISNNELMNRYFNNHSDDDCKRLQDTIRDIADNKNNTPEEEALARSILRLYTAKWMMWAVVGDCSHVRLA